MKILEDYTQKDKKMNQIADKNMMRCENLSLLGINSAVE
jgi:hypothetical protein